MYLFWRLDYKQFCLKRYEACSFHSRLLPYPGRQHLAIDDTEGEPAHLRRR